MRFLFFLTIVLIFSGCQTVKDKTDEIVKKENQMLGKFIGKEVSILKSELGRPTDEFIEETGENILLYKTKKYGIPCERKFEINKSGIVTGFVSKGCF